MTCPLGLQWHFKGASTRAAMFREGVPVLVRRNPFSERLTGNCSARQVCRQTCRKLLLTRSEGDSNSRETFARVGGEGKASGGGAKI